MATWADDGFWAPDGVHSEFITPIIGLVWLTVVSGFLVMRGRATVSSADRAAVPAA